MDARPITAQVPPDGPGSAAAGPSQPAPPRPGHGGDGHADAAASAAFAHALVSASRAPGGHGLISTAGGYTAQLAHQEEATPVLLARAAAAAKAAGGLLALALGPAPGAGHPAGWPRAVPAAASVPLIAYGKLNVLAAALVLSDILHPRGP